MLAINSLPSPLKTLVISSICLSIIAFAFSMGISFGGSSIFLDVSAAVLTVIYHITILIIMSQRTRNNDSSQSNSVYSALASIVCGYILALIWLVSVVVVIITMFVGWSSWWHDGRIQALLVLEVIFDVTAASVMLAIPTLALKERKRGVQRDGSWKAMGA